MQKMPKDESKNFRASHLEAWEIDTANALKRLFLEKAELTQRSFGARYGIGSAGMVNQYINGKRPLGLAAAIKFANGLGVQVSEISPTLAAQLPKPPSSPATADLLARYEQADASVQAEVDELTSLPPEEAIKLAAIIKSIRATYAPKT